MKCMKMYYTQMWRNGTIAKTQQKRLNLFLTSLSSSVKHSLKPMMEACDFSENLINLIREYPALYDKTNRKYKLNTERERIWKSIAKEMGASAVTCKKKWNYMRDKFIKIYKKVKQQEEAGTDTSQLRNWAFYDNLLFLKDQDAGESGPGNFVSCESYADMDEDGKWMPETDGNEDSVASVNHIESSALKRRKNDDDNESEILEISKPKIEFSENHEHINGFCLLISSYLKKWDRTAQNEAIQHIVSYVIEKDFVEENKNK